MSVRILIQLILVMSLLISCSDSNRGPEAKISIKVINENNQAIDDALVKIGFLSNSDRNKEITFSGKVNNQGVFTATGKTNGLVGATISKQGCYDSTVDYPFTKKSGNHWEPWNPVVTVTLRKIENPVPMYARRADLELPALDEEVGFDLLKYDWTAPYGKGTHSDVNFKSNRKWISDLEFEGSLTIRFSGALDGIQVVKENRAFGSQLKLPRYAPKKGYKNQIQKNIKALPGQGINYDYAEDINYIFRCRSEYAEGKLIKAMYGKVQGDISFGFKGTKTATIGFNYYLNPDHTRNLEFDPKRNLFTDLKTFERVGL